MSNSIRPLYVVVKPPSDLARYIAAHPRASASRGPELLHMTVQPLGDRKRSPPELLPFLLEIMATLDASAFRLVFDRIVDTGRTIALRASEQMRGAQTFRAALMTALTRHGLSIEPPYRFVPHITIAYRSDGLGNWPIDPISWRAEEFLLVESLVGQGKHVEHGRWPLHA